MKIKNSLILFFTLILLLPARADKLDKGFQRLYLYDYFLAKEYFEKSLKKKTAGAAYGLSMIFSRINNPFYDLDSARYYIFLCDSVYKQLNEKDKNYYKTWEISSANIQSQKDLVCEKAFQDASSIATVEKFNKYMNDFSYCTKARTAWELRNSLAYRETKSKNNSAAYRFFIDTYPDAKEVQEASNRYTERVYEETTEDKNISSYEKYLKLFPESPLKLQAEKKIYTLSVPHKSIDEYHSFVKKYPSNRYAEEAWREIFTIYTKDYNEHVFQNFKTRYPDYPFMNELETDFELQRALFLPFRKNNFWGYINESGEEKIKPDYEEVSLFSEGLAAVQKNGSYGYVNKSGKEVIPFIYDDAEAFKNNTAIVRKKGKAGLINRFGVELIPFVYDDLADPSENIYVAVLNEKSGYVSKSGKKITEFIFDFAGDFCDGYAIAGANDKYGLLNAAGSFIIVHHRAAI